MIKAVLFDFDGVLTTDKTGSISITSYIARQTGLPLEKVRQSYAPYNKRLLYGGLRHEEMWDDFCKALGQPLDYQLLTDSFIRTPLDERMIQLVKQLKKSYLTGMVTDNKCDRIETVLSHHRLSECFDIVAVSAQLLSGKDQPAIFEYALRHLNVRADECIFVDNTAKNLIVPGKMGIKTMLFDDENRDVDTFLRELNKLLQRNQVTPKMSEAMA